MTENIWSGEEPREKELNYSCCSMVIKNCVFKQGGNKPKWFKTEHRVRCKQMTSQIGSISALKLPYPLSCNKFNSTPNINDWVRVTFYNLFYGLISPCITWQNEQTHLVQKPSPQETLILKAGYKSHSSQMTEGCRNLCFPIKVIPCKS